MYAEFIGDDDACIQAARRTEHGVCCLKLSEARRDEPGKWKKNARGSKWLGSWSPPRWKPSYSPPLTRDPPVTGNQPECASSSSSVRSSVYNLSRRRFSSIVFSFPHLSPFFTSFHRGPFSTSSNTLPIRGLFFILFFFVTRPSLHLQTRGNHRNRALEWPIVSRW